MAANRLSYKSKAEICTFLEYEDRIGLPSTEWSCISIAKRYVLRGNWNDPKKIPPVNYFASEGFRIALGKYSLCCCGHRVFGGRGALALVCSSGRIHRSGRRGMLCSLVQGDLGPGPRCFGLAPGPDHRKKGAHLDFRLCQCRIERNEVFFVQDLTLLLLYESGNLAPGPANHKKVAWRRRTKILRVVSQFPLLFLQFLHVFRHLRFF